VSLNPTFKRQNDPSVLLYAPIHEAQHSANGYVIVRRRIRNYRFPRLVRLSLAGGRDVFLDEHVEDLCSDRADGKLQSRAFLR